MPRAIGYIRCSTQEQADSGLGLDAQAERIRAYAAMKGLALEVITEPVSQVGSRWPNGKAVNDSWLPSSSAKRAPS